MQRNLIIPITLLFSRLVSFAALPTNNTLTWEVRPTNGNDLYGGCFVSSLGGTDYTQQNTAQYNFTDLVIAATTTNVTSVSHSFVTADVGNCIHISAGTGFTTGWYEIVSVTTGVATLDRSAGTAASTSGTWYEGGALATLTQLNINMDNGQVAWVKAESNISIASGINFNFGGGTGGGNEYPAISGYTTTRNDGGYVTITATAGMAPMITLSVYSMRFADFTLNCNSQSNTAALYLNQNASQAVNITATGCTSSAINLNNPYTTCVNCAVSNSFGNQGIYLGGNPSSCYYCSVFGVAIVNNGSINATGAVICVGCIVANNSTGGKPGFLVTVSQNQFICINCVAYNNTGDGFNINSAGYGNITLLNCIAYGNGGYGINIISGPVPLGYTFNFNGYGSNTSGNLNNANAGYNDVTLTANPFVNGASNNFALNSTAGGGASLRGTGFPGVLGLGGTGYMDIGTLQHQSTSSSVTTGYPIVQ